MEQMTEKSPSSSVVKRQALRVIQPGGVLSSKMPGFEVRMQQQAMLENIVDAYEKNHIALVEAGTGTGKSLAYLIPAMLFSLAHKERTVISTNTIGLQEQLIQKDIPFLIEALNLDIKAVLVKGMGNYLCLRKFQDALDELSFLPEQEAKELRDIEMWSEKTSEGSKSDLSFVPLPSVWDKVSAEGEACNHVQCPFYQQIHSV